MSEIPKFDIQLFFSTYFGQTFKLMNFELPELKYENGNISFYETVIICLICKNFRPKSILEFGTFNGRTTINIAANTPDNASIMTVDLPKDKINNTMYPLEGSKKEDKHDELGYVGKINKLYTKYPFRNKIHQLWMDTAEFPAEKYLKAFKFIFVDASHSYRNVLNDSYTALKCVMPQGIILWHDYNGWPGVTEALDEVFFDSTKQYCFCHIEGTSMVLYYADNS